MFMNWGICSCRLQQDTVGTDLCTGKQQIWFNLSCCNSHMQNIRRSCPWLQSRFSLYLTNLCIWPSCYTYSAVLVWHQEPVGIPTPLIFLYGPCQSIWRHQGALSILGYPMSCITHVGWSDCIHGHAFSLLHVQTKIQVSVQLNSIEQFERG